MKLRIGFVIAVAGLLAAGNAAAQKAAAGSKLAADKGKLRILLDGQQVGTEEFQLSGSGTDWTSHSEVKLQTPGGPSAKITSNLRLGAQERPLSYDWSLEGDRKISGRVQFEGGLASVELRQGSESPFTQQHMFGEQRVVILDNNVYHHYGILGRLYDWEKKGPQNFLLYVPQETIPGNATLESAGTQEVDGAKYDVLRLRTDDIEVFLLFDKQRLMRITVPGSKVMVVRE